MFGRKAPFFEAALEGSFAAQLSASSSSSVGHRCFCCRKPRSTSEFEGLRREVARGCSTILNRWSIWSTVQYSPGTEPLLAVERLYLFQPFVLGDIHIEAVVLFPLPIVDHLADCVYPDRGRASKTVWDVDMANVLGILVAARLAKI